MEKRRFHFIYALHYMRYGLLLCLVPMVQALVRFDLSSLYQALRQDAVILICIAVLALALRRFSAVWLAGDTLYVQQGVLYRSRRAISPDSVAVLEICRPLSCRVLGASRVTLYFRDNFSPRRYKLYLSRRDALKVADALMPVKSDTAFFEPTGFERIAFVMLSANIVTSSIFAVMTANRVRDVLGDTMEHAAIENFTKFELWIAQFLPAGMAFLAAVLFVVISFAFLYTLVHTAGFTVCRNGGVLVNCGGLITKIERRMQVAHISSCDVQITPVARVLRRYPVFVTAGSFRSDMPVFVYKKGREHLLTALLPDFAPVHGPLCLRTRKSAAQYLWLPGTMLGLSLALCGAAVTVMPGLLPVLAVPVLLASVSLLVSLEGYCKEGLGKNVNRTLSICYTRFFTRHEVCVFARDIAYLLLENPLSISGGRCDAHVYLPGRFHYRARGVQQYLAKTIPFTL